MKALLFIFIISCQVMVGQALECTTLSSPSNGAVDVSVFANLEWTASAAAEGYLITVSTVSGGNDILDGADAGDVTTYDLPQALPPTQTIYVTIAPYAGATNLVCSETNFTTGVQAVPRCTEIINPFNGDALVPVSANITWIRDFNATGYLMTVRVKDPDGVFVWDRVDVGNGTNAKPPDFLPRTRYYITIIPYNDAGPAVGCLAITFTTGDAPPLPKCTALIFPKNGATQINVDTDLEWAPVSAIDGYLLSVGTAPGGTDILDRWDTGLENTYNLLDDLPIGTKIYVLITTYKNALESKNCEVSSFVTIAAPPMVFESIVPAFFTPNNDGYNDTWAVKSSEKLVVGKVFVFDRYGKLLVQLQEGQTWNGTFNGWPLPSGSYWYSVQIDNFQNIKGHFLLKR